MAASQNVTVSSGISGLTLLGILFVGLKLTGHITWPWWLVTLPFWGGLVVGLVIVVFLLAIVILHEILR